MQNRWFSNDKASVLNPWPLTAGVSQIPPPFPPDPAPSTSLSHFPPLTSPVQKKPLSSPQTAPLVEPVGVTPVIANEVNPSTTDVEMAQSDSCTTDLDPGTTISLSPRSDVTVTVTEKFNVLAPKSTSPLLTNKASTSALHPPKVNPHLPTSKGTSASSFPQPTQFEQPKENPTIPGIIPSVPKSSTTTSTTPASTTYIPTIPAKNMAERLRKPADRSLKRLTPLSFAESGRPRVLIPDEVFQRGAEIHKDFIICYFNGITLSYHQILCKGRRLEIHLNHKNRSMLVRIPNDFIRQEVLEKCIWYIGDSMFHTAQWSSHHSTETPALKSIPIWIHLFGIPLDLRHWQCVSLVAGLVGEPKETDAFTKNIVSLKVAHAKVEVDLTKPLPNVVEFESQNGEVVEVEVEYPWLPPSYKNKPNPQSFS